MVPVRLPGSPSDPVGPPAAEATHDKVQDLTLRYSGIYYLRNEHSQELNQVEMEKFAARLRGARDAA